MEMSLVVLDNAPFTNMECEDFSRIPLQKFS